jgi:hypothetical protein
MLPMIIEVIDIERSKAFGGLGCRAFSCSKPGREQPPFSTEPKLCDLGHIIGEASRAQCSQSQTPVEYRGPSACNGLDTGPTLASAIADRNRNITE